MSGARQPPRPQLDTWPDGRAWRRWGSTRCAVPLSPGVQHHLALLTPALERVAGRPVKGIADPRVARMADLLGAVGDLLHDEQAAFGPDERDALALRAKILAGIETAGRSTLGFLEQAPNRST
jgi:hypothetical protein